MAAEFFDAVHAVRVTRNLVFGHAPVGHGGSRPRDRALTLDVYEPQVMDDDEHGVGVGVGVGVGLDAGRSLPATGVRADRTASGRPALILSHGGAYHRGSKEEDLFEQDGRYNTPVAQYCRRFAARGYVCFSVGYRLTQELPSPQPEPIKRDRDQNVRGRMDFVRQLLGLPAANAQQLLAGQEAAIADVAAACRFVHQHAQRWQIDATRIAIGGFSAGAFSSIYAAYVLRAPAAAIVSLSGGMESVDCEHYVQATTDSCAADAAGQWPPVLLFASEFDLPGIPERTAALAAHLHGVNIGYRQYRVPGAPHFYDAQTKVHQVAGNYPGGAIHTSVEEAMRDFLVTALRLPIDASRRTADADMPAADQGIPTPDHAMLQAFADAWNRHDLDGLMSFMTDDCEFRSSAGPDACGSRYVGRDEVRAGFARAWADIPDAQWTGARHFVAGDRGVSQWTFTGTRTSDGARIEVDGCDLFTFEGARIRIKDSWRKQRG